MSITTPINPAPCSSIEEVLRTIDEAVLTSIYVDDTALEIIIPADLVDTSAAPDVICKKVTFVFSGVTRNNALAALPVGVTTGDSVTQIGVDLIVDFFNGSVPVDDVVVIGLDVRNTVQEAIKQALRNGLGGAA